MKIRIRGNAIRLRLMQNEVAEIAEKGIFQEETHFPSGEKFTYALEAAQVPALQAHFSGNKICIKAPEAEVKHWANSDQVGMENFVELPSGETLRILVEKDFKCLTPRDHEPEEQAYENPLDKHTC